MQEVTRNRFTALFPELSLGLKPEEIDPLLAALEYEDLSAGETPIVHGTESDALYLIWKGQLKVFVNTDQGEQEVAMIGPGSMFGEVTLLDPGKASATVRSEQGCTALVLPRDKLEKLWGDHPKIAAKFLGFLSRHLSQRIRSITNQLNGIYASR